MFLYSCFCPGYKQGPSGAHKKVLAPSDWSTRDRMDNKSFSKFLCMYVFIYLWVTEWKKRITICESLMFYLDFSGLIPNLSIIVSQITVHILNHH